MWVAGLLCGVRTRGKVELSDSSEECEEYAAYVDGRQANVWVGGLVCRVEI